MNQLSAPPSRGGGPPGPSRGGPPGPSRGGPPGPSVQAALRAIKRRATKAQWSPWRRSSSRWPRRSTKEKWSSGWRSTLQSFGGTAHQSGGPGGPPKRSGPPAGGPGGPPKRSGPPSGGRAALQSAVVLQAVHQRVDHQVQTWGSSRP